MTSATRHVFAVENLLYQLLETELCGLEVFRAARKVAVQGDLQAAWDQFLTHSAHHVAIAREVLEAIGLDPTRETPARAPIRGLTRALVEAIDDASAVSDPATVEIVAAEALATLASRDLRNWELLGLVARGLQGGDGAFVREALARVGPEAARDLSHAEATARRLWQEALGQGDQLGATLLPAMEPVSPTRH